MQGIEAMFDAMQLQEGMHPHDPARQNRNPLNLRASPTPHMMSGTGYCVFESIVLGTSAGMDEIEAKITGNNGYGIGPDSTLDQLFDVYAPRGDGDNNPNVYAMNVAEYCTYACGRAIYHTTKLRDVCPEFFTTE